MTTPTISDTLRALARDASDSALSTDDLTAASALLTLARALSALADQADAGRMLITTRGATLGPDPLHEPPPPRLSGATPALRGDERLWARERGGRE